MERFHDGLISHVHGFESHIRYAYKNRPAAAADRKGKTMYRTGSGEAIRFDMIPERMDQFRNATKQFGSDYQIIIGTDSQNFSDTKIVTVIAIVCKGHGGIFFYEVSRKPVIKNVRLKLQVETTDSLITAQRLIDLLEGKDEYSLLYRECPLAIHVDAGNSEKGRTRELIPEIVGWIRACGYNAFTKPDSFVASTIADRISK